MRAGYLILMMVGAGGCGLSEEKFADQASEAICDKFDECAAEADDTDVEGYEDFFTALCVPLVQGSFAAAAEQCEYDKKAAKKCLAAIEAASCSDGEDAYSASCEAVYGADCAAFSDTDTDVSL